MPRLNDGTLLENIVVLETTRICLEKCDRIAFATAFAMPPRTECWSNPPVRDAFLGGLSLEHLELCDPAPNSLQDLWFRCFHSTELPICLYRPKRGQNVTQHSSGGPNGALLAAMLAAQVGCRIDLWVNDDGGRYGEVPPAEPNSKSEGRLTGAYAATLVEAPQNSTTEFVSGDFPGTISDLENWLANGEGQAAKVRVGFLDPDCYSNAKKPKESDVESKTHTKWLEALADDCRHVLSVIFSGNRGGGVESSHFCSDGCELFRKSLVFKTGNFQTGVKIRWPEDSFDQVATDLKERIRCVWKNWPQSEPLKVLENVCRWIEA